MSEKTTALKPVVTTEITTLKVPDILDGFTPEDVKRRLLLQKKLRDTFLDVVRASLSEDVHYMQPARKGALPYLKQEGALLLMHFYQCEDEYIIERETYENGFYAITMRCHLKHPSEKVYQGIGWANSKEYNFMSTVEAQTRNALTNPKNMLTEDQIREGFFHTQMETIQQMCRKRALVNASRHLPFVSELFTQEADNGNGNTQEKSPDEASKRLYNLRFRTLKHYYSDIGIDDDEPLKKHLSNILGVQVTSKKDFVMDEDLWDKFETHVQITREEKNHERE